MADDELLPKFHGGKDRTLARQLGSKVQDRHGYEKQYQTNADGSTTRLETRGGMPEVITDRVDTKSDDFNFSGLSFFPRNVSEKIGQALTLRLASDSRPLVKGRNPSSRIRRGSSFAYAMSVGVVGGLSVTSDGSVKCFWMTSKHKIRNHMPTWDSIVSESVSTNSDDGEIIPFSAKSAEGKKLCWASRWRIVERGNKAIYSMTVPERTVYSGTPKKYDLLPAQVVCSNGKVILQCSDSQTFKDRPKPGDGVLTDLTRYFQTVVFDVSNSSEILTTGNFQTFSPDPVTSASSNNDAASLSSIYACHAYEGWIYHVGDETGNPTGEGIARINEVVSTQNRGTPLRADSSSTSSINDTSDVPFTKSVIDETVVPARLKRTINYSGSSSITQQYSDTTGADPFINEDRWNPYQVTLARTRFKGALDISETLSEQSSVVIGEMEYPFFSITGSSSCAASKENEATWEMFHPTYGQLVDDGSWFVSGIGAALEAACGYTYAEMIAWYADDVPGIGTKVVKMESEAPDRISACSVSATGNYYIAADASLRFSARVEFRFDFNLSQGSSPGDKWKWMTPQSPNNVPINITVSLVVFHDGNETREVLFSDAVVMPPPVRSVAYPNPYYFIQLQSGSSTAAQITADGADVCWVYQVPNFETQPSFYNSLDTVIQSQQTSEYVAGYSAHELSAASQKNQSFSKYQPTVISSRRIKLRELGADWLFSYYKIDRPLSLAPEETDPAKTRPYGFSDSLYHLMFNTTIRFEADTNQIRLWLEDVDSHTTDLPDDKNAYCFRV